MGGLSLKNDTWETTSTRSENSGIPENILSNLSKTDADVLRNYIVGTHANRIKEEPEAALKADPPGYAGMGVDRRRHQECEKALLPTNSFGGTVEESPITWIDAWETYFKLYDTDHRTGAAMVMRRLTGAAYHLIRKEKETERNSHWKILQLLKEHYCSGDQYTEMLSQFERRTRYRSETPGAYLQALHMLRDEANQTKGCEEGNELKNKLCYFQFMRGLNHQKFAEELGKHLSMWLDDRPENYSLNKLARKANQLWNQMRCDQTDTASTAPTSVTKKLNKTVPVSSITMTTSSEASTTIIDDDEPFCLHCEGPHDVGDCTAYKIMMISQGEGPPTNMEVPRQRNYYTQRAREAPRCFNCGEEGHMRARCPHPKKTGMAQRTGYEIPMHELNKTAKPRFADSPIPRSLDLIMGRLDALEKLLRDQGKWNGSRTLRDEVTGANEHQATQKVFSISEALNR